MSRPILYNLTCSADANCKLIYDLPFCKDVAYSVPTNKSATRDDLIGFYDANAQSLYKNFTFSLQQIPCNTTSSAQYSLARNCSDCDRDYQTWLCAVTIPRCDDFTPSSPARDYLMPRNVRQDFINGTAVDLGAAGMAPNATDTPWTAHSRFAAIDDVIRPGPYRELMPCLDLCHELVRSCPASLQFGCPSQGPLSDRTYGVDDGQRMCNRVGADQPARSAAVRIGTGPLWVVMLICAVWMSY
jgi:calcium channel MID1